MEFFPNTDEVLSINRNDFKDEDEYQEEREREDLRKNLGLVKTK
jgi:hypothetical protein